MDFAKLGYAMMTPEVLGNVLGFSAGFILLASGFPAMWEQIVRPNRGTVGERRSRLLMAVGNLVWVVAGVITSIWPVIVMCGINSIIQALIWQRMRRHLP